MMVSYKRIKKDGYDLLVFKKNNSVIQYKVDPNLTDISFYRNAAITEWKKKP